jgi:hypothetical protein
MKLSFTLIHLFAICLGGLIYILFRPTNLIMFQWFDEINLTDFFKVLRFNFIPIKNSLPEWFIYSLPDGLWLLSFNLIMVQIWRNESHFFIWFWTILLPIIAVTSEIGQLLNIVPGTFDPNDILFYSLVIILIIINNKWMNYEKIN